MVLKRIANDLGVGQIYLAQLAFTASHRYKEYTIPKIKGGERKIFHPSRKLKVVQRWISKNIFARLPDHSACFSYKEGVSIVDHARFHANSNFLMRIDFSNFFESIVKRDIQLLLETNQRLLSNIEDIRDIDLICQFVCRNDRLTIGAPSSPIISNKILHDLDHYWATVAKNRKSRYSRYADDIYFSSNEVNILPDILKDFSEFIDKLDSPELQINSSKTIFTSRKHRRVVTGIFITPSGGLSLGRTRKRNIKSSIFEYLRSGGDEKERKRLAGMISFSAFVEPIFVESLKNKYGKEYIDNIIRDK